jgi:hypothetical protein
MTVDPATAAALATAIRESREAREAFWPYRRTSRRKQIMGGARVPAWPTLDGQVEFRYV